MPGTPSAPGGGGRLALCGAAGSPTGYLHLVTGIMDTQALIALAKGMNTTVNSLLAAIPLKALLKAREKSPPEGQKAGELSSPVNLRRYYPPDAAQLLLLCERAGAPGVWELRAWRI